jgi:transposase
VVRTYAPRGETPVLCVPLTRDHLSVMGAVTDEGRLLLRIQERAFSGPAVVRFLRHLLQQLPGKVLLIWDGAPIHRNHSVGEFLGAGAAARLHIEPLPGYAPELMPLEGIWQHLKHRELCNVVCHNQQELRHELQLAVARLRRKPHIITGCIRECGY